MKLLLTICVVVSMLTFKPLSGQTEGFKCPWDEVDCPGKCGRFYDADGDGFCDYGRVSAVAKPDTPVVVKDTPKNNNTTTTAVNPNNGNNKPNDENDSVTSDSNQSDSIPTKVAEDNKSSKQHSQRSYSLILITSCILLLYLITSVLHRRKVIRKFVHRRFWNVLLLITFLTSAILGIILVLQINYNLGTEYILSYLYWHVQFGIAMAVIAFIHLLWHWKYFYQLMSPKSKSDCIDS